LLSSTIPLQFLPVFNFLVASLMAAWVIST
jgi:hypothetical protein